MFFWKKNKDKIDPKAYADALSLIAKIEKFCKTHVVSFPTNPDKFPVMDTLTIGSAFTAPIKAILLVLGKVQGITVGYLKDGKKGLTPATKADWKEGEELLQEVLSKKVPKKKVVEVVVSVAPKKIRKKKVPKGGMGTTKNSAYIELAYTDYGDSPILSESLRFDSKNETFVVGQTHAFEKTAKSITVDQACRWAHKHKANLGDDYKDIIESIVCINDLLFQNRLVAVKPTIPKKIRKKRVKTETQTEGKPTTKAVRKGDVWEMLIDVAE
jgi:hypothetical protein